MSRDKLWTMILEFKGSDLVGRRVELDAVAHVYGGHQRTLATDNLIKDWNVLIRQTSLHTLNQWFLTFLVFTLNRSLRTSRIIYHNIIIIEPRWLGTSALNLVVLICCGRSVRIKTVWIRQGTLNRGSSEWQMSTCFSCFLLAVGILKKIFCIYKNDLF